MFGRKQRKLRRPALLLACVVDCALSRRQQRVAVARDAMAQAQALFSATEPC